VLWGADMEEKLTFLPSQDGASLKVKHTAEAVQFVSFKILANGAYRLQSIT
jgi:hypothetical protein